MLNAKCKVEAEPSAPVLCILHFALRTTCYFSHYVLLRLFVRRVLPAEPAVLAQLEALGRLLLVLRRAVVPPLTLGTGKMNDVSHGVFPVSGQQAVGGGQ